MAGRSGDTAETLILIGLILQVITVVILFGVGLLLSIVPFLGGVVLLLAFFGLIFVVLVYVYSYARTREADFEGARTPTLVFGILSLISLGLISGILYIVAYVKLGDAADEEEREKDSRTPRGGSQPFPYRPMASGASTPGLAAPPLVPAPAVKQVFCSNCGQPTLSSARFCRNCGSPLQ